MTKTQAKYLRRRDEILARAKARHERDMQSPAYRELRAVRCRISECKESISRLRAKVAEYRHRLGERRKEIWRLTRRKEELELQWGAERAQRKRSAAA
jgi:chromosome segregation ATPase